MVLYHCRKAWAGHELGQESTRKTESTRLRRRTVQTDALRREMGDGRCGGVEVKWKNAWPITHTGCCKKRSLLLRNCDPL